MDRAGLGLKLKQFYLLEVYQVRMFGDQLPSLHEEHIIKGYERMLGHEREHVADIAEKLRAYGFDEPDPAEEAISLAGVLSGKALDLSGLAGKLKTGAAIEKEAAKMYEKFIEAADDEALLEILWRNRIDEEFHQYWFAAELAALAHGEPAHVSG